MTDPVRPDVTLNTLHEDLTAGFGEMRAGFADLKTTLIAGFRSLPSRESSEEMVRLLREANRLQEERLAKLDVRIREQHIEQQQASHALIDGQRLLVESQRQLVESQQQVVESQRQLVESQQQVVESQQRLAESQQQLIESQRQLVESQRQLVENQRSLSADLRALIARIDALVRRRGDGGPPA
jgi:paraquat-inducible protein B